MHKKGLGPDVAKESEEDFALHGGRCWSVKLQRDFTPVSFHSL